jgi:hypothetical protein
MVLLTKKDILSNLPERWKSQYRTNYQLSNGKMTFDIINELEAETNLTEERAKEILGNDSWTRNKCDECNADVYATVQLGQEPDYESATANICLDCLNKAVALAGA